MPLILLWSPLDDYLADLIVTPHVSGIGSLAVRRRIAEIVRGNVARFIAAEPLLHRVA